MLANPDAIVHDWDHDNRGTPRSFLSAPLPKFGAEGIARAKSQQLAYRH